jgi:hypothetical protein
MSWLFFLKEKRKKTFFEKPDTKDMFDTLEIERKKKELSSILISHVCVFVRIFSASRLFFLLVYSKILTGKQNSFIFIFCFINIIFLKPILITLNQNLLLKLF